MPPGPTLGAPARPMRLAADLGSVLRRGYPESRTAIVIRVVAHRRPSSSVKSTSHTHVVRPRWRRRPTASTVPSVMGRRNVVALLIPIAVLPSPDTARYVASDVSDSAIEAS